MSELKRNKLLDGIYFNCVFDDRFKTNRIAVNMITRLDKKDASQNALLSYLLVKGYDKYPDFAEFNRYLDELYGAVVYSDIYKAGDCQVISLGISGIDDRFTLENEGITKTLCEILSKMLLSPALEGGKFRESEVELEKNTLIDTINAQINDKRSFALNKASEIMCESEPFGLNECGEIQSVKALDAQSVTKAYYDLLESARIEIMFVGSGDCKVAEEIFKSAFSNVKRNFKKETLADIHIEKGEIKEVTERFDVAQSKMVLGFACENKDEKVDFALSLLCAVYGGTPMSKLFLNVREKLSLCYYCAARYNKTKSLMFVDCGVESENILKAKEEILRQLDEIKNGNITDEEIKNAVMSLENAYRTINDSNSSVMRYYFMQILSDKDYTPEQQIEFIKNVTKEDIVKAANRIKLETVYLLTGKEEA